ncbi:hypothetical protein HG536_0B04520 [Torulaspora globosa]|uniref:Transmembrane 9 superfamily member n=1 Tax=Torulaspora globosa TaxID=48254 RepID=A0A7G3ZDK2_9SACH|nr:uncharacterized protein HG536_0B04520 [Torulaspora globosa]QLL31588.1 hypothetical protein HG536_0B04520 [Torulaspora globosa]
MILTKKRVWGYLTMLLIFVMIFRNSASWRHSAGDDKVGGGWLKPNLYKWGDSVELIVNKVESDLTQLPFGYYDLPFTCPPTEGKKPLHLSLSEIIKGDRKWESDYKLWFGQDSACEGLCARKTTPEGMRRARELVRDGYVVQWLIDEELPAATTFISTTDHKKYYASGFPLGFVDPDTGKSYLNNHVMLVIRYNAVNGDTFSIVGFEVYPRSVSDQHCPGASKDYDQYEIVIPEDENELTYIPFTYSVYWREEFNVDWSHRWNFFLNSGEISEGSSVKFHWMTLCNSVGIAFLITFIVVVNLIKVLKTGSSRTNDDFQFTFDDDDNVDSIYAVARTWLSQTDSSSWSLRMHTIATSVGVHFLFTVLGSLTISCSLNRLHNIRNSVVTMAVFCFVIGAFMASYVGTRLRIEYHSFRNEACGHYRAFAVLCGSALPGLVTISTQLLNSIIRLQESSSALPFRTVMIFISIYFANCIPLSLLGGEAAYRMYRKCGASFAIPSALRMRNSFKPLKAPTCRTGSLSMKNVRAKLTFGSIAVLLCGLFPFAIIYVEMQYIYKSAWLEKTTFYHFYGFLLANILMLCVVVCEISLLGCYVLMKMNKKDRRMTTSNSWRWNCFLMGTSCAWYMELYTLYYLFHTLNITGFSSIFISVSYSLIFNIMAGIGMGSLGYLTCCWFVNKVYRTKYMTA